MGAVNLSVHEEMVSLDLLYGSLSIVDKLCQGGESAARFNVHVADRVMDSMNAISVAKYRRCSLEEQSLPALLWLMQYLIASAMFLGVLMIQSGSDQLNMGMCFVCTTLIGMNSLVIADMDIPYHGFIRLKIDSIVELYDYLNAVVQSDARSKVSLARQAGDFFSSKEARRSSVARVEASIASKLGRGKSNRVAAIDHRRHQQEAPDVHVGYNQAHELSNGEAPELEETFNGDKKKDDGISRPSTLTTVRPPFEE